MVCSNELLQRSNTPEPQRFGGVFLVCGLVAVALWWQAPDLPLAYGREIIQVFFDRPSDILRVHSKKLIWWVVSEFREGFRYRTTFSEEYRPRKRSKIAYFVRVAAQAFWNSVQKLALSTFSSLKKQDFRENTVSHGREFLLSMLLYRKIWKMSSSRQEFLVQSRSTGTRKLEKKASVPKPGCHTSGMKCIPLSAPHHQ